MPVPRKDGAEKEKPALIPAFSPGEKEKRLPRLGKRMATDLRRFRGSMHEFFREIPNPTISLGEGVDVLRSERKNRG